MWEIDVVLSRPRLVHSLYLQEEDSSVPTTANRHLFEKEVLGLRVWMIIAGVVEFALLMHFALFQRF